MQPQRKETRMIRKAIYRLKRDYGFPLRLYKITDVTMDLETGTKKRAVTFKQINRAVLVSARFYRSFVYDLSYIAAAKDFTSGGFFDAHDRAILLDWQDTRDFEIKVDDYVVYDNKQYVITEIRHFEFKTLYLIKVRGVRGSEVIDPGAFEMASEITLTQTVVAEVT
jgi:hypothetical protein